jgi:hypothetical protein
MSEERTKANTQLIRHLRRSRFYAKELFSVAPEKGSVLISHRVEVKTPINDNETMITVIDMLPVTRIYRTKNAKIVDDENLLNEDTEESTWD